MSSQNQYKIPWVNIILIFIIALGILSVMAGTVIGILCGHPELVLPSFILMIVLGVVFFINIQFWTNVMFYPVKRWILKKVNCIKCGHTFTNCEYVMAHAGPFASFICYCKNCRKAGLIETGTFTRTLTFKSDLGIEAHYEQKYHNEAYKVPFGIWVIQMATMCIIPLILGFLVVGIPVIIYLIRFGPSKEVAERFRSIKTELWITLLLLFDILYWKVERFRNLLTYPIRCWILKNVKCPACKNFLINCDLKIPSSFFDFFNYFNLYIGYCEHCGKQRKMKIDGFDWLLRFI